MTRSHTQINPGVSVLFLGRGSPGPDSRASAPSSRRARGVFEASSRRLRGVCSPHTMVGVLVVFGAPAPYNGSIATDLAAQSLTSRPWNLLIIIVVVRGKKSPTKRGVRNRNAHIRGPLSTTGESVSGDSGARDHRPSPLHFGPGWSKSLVGVSPAPVMRENPENRLPMTPLLPP